MNAPNAPNAATVAPAVADGAPGRVDSLDVFRGLAVALMILVNNPGSWQHLYPPLAHAAWHGCTPTDLVFPFFLFAVGQALALAVPGWLAAAPALFWRKWAWRTLLLLAIGLLLNASPFVRWDAGGHLVPRDWTLLRWLGVLQRIALAWAGAALLVMACRGRLRPVLGLAGAMLLVYWWACVAWGDAADPYSLEGFFGTRWDRALLGTAHLYRGEGVPFDPEGLASTWPAVVQVLLGWAAGEALRGLSPAQRIGGLRRLVIAALALAAVAWAWQMAMPLNKKLWTSSYVLWTTALALLAYAALAVLLDRPRPLPGVPALARPLRAFGRNALGIFVLSGLVMRFQGLIRWPDAPAPDGTARWLSPWLTPWQWAWQRVFEPLAADARLGSMLQALALLAAYAALALWLDRRRWYWRL